jgi:hypothetical protein
MHYIGFLVLVLWLIVGAIAAGQRHDYTRPPVNCSQAATIAETILAGPPNFLGVDPEISCRHLPPPAAAQQISKGGGAGPPESGLSAIRRRCRRALDRI